MEYIYQNPFRILGVTANAGSKEFSRQRSRINAYLKAGKEISFPGEIRLDEDAIRTEETVKKSLNALQDSAQKIRYAFFWFIKETKIDEVALNHLATGNLSKAMEIWGKVAGDIDGYISVNERNMSAINNLGTAYMISSQYFTDERKHEAFSKGVICNAALIDSPLFYRISQIVADETYKPEPKTFLAENLNISTTLGERLGIKKTVLHSLLSQKSSKLASHLVGNKIETYQKQLDQDLSKAKEQFESRNLSLDGQRSYTPLYLGIALHHKIKEPLSFLKNQKEVDEFSWTVYADRAADYLHNYAVLAINDLKKYKKHHSITLSKLRTDFGIAGYSDNYYSAAEKLLRQAQALTSNTDLSARIKESIEHVRDQGRVEIVEEELSEINKLLEKGIRAEALSDVKEFVEEVRPYVLIIKKKLGENDEKVVSIGTTISAIALGKTIETINAAQQPNQLLDPFGYDIRDRLSRAMVLALDIMRLVEPIPKSYDAYNHFHTNFNTLKSIARQVNVKIPSSKPLEPTSIFGTAKPSTPQRTSASNYSSSSHNNSRISQTDGSCIGTAAFIIFIVILMAAMAG